MELQHILQQPHSSCGDCVFSEFKAMVQTGCKLNKLEIFEKAKGIKVLEAEDEEKEFYLILGSYCFWSRGKTWVKKWREGHGFNEEQLVAQATEETRLAYDAIIWVQDQNIDPVIETVNNILAFERRPEKILVVNVSMNLDIIHLTNWMNTTCSPIGQKFVVKDIVDKTETIWSAIHRASRDCKSSFLFLTEAGQTIPTDATEKIHKRLFEEIKEFAVVKFDYNSCLCLSSAYERVGIYDVNFLSELYDTIETMGIQEKFKTYEEYLCQE